MAKNSYYVCVIPSWWTESQIHARTCTDGSHAHMPRKEAIELLGIGEAELIGERAVRRLAIRKNIRDMSAKVGEFLSTRVRQKHDWALAMYAQILNRTEPPAAENLNL